MKSVLPHPLLLKCHFSPWQNFLSNRSSWNVVVRRSLASGPSKKRLDVAVVGLPNAGKSQLLNVLTQSTVSAVSRKRHTTRHVVLGARTVRNTQLLFLDTPGFLRAQDAKKEGLVDRKHLAESATHLSTVDHTLLVVDAARNLTDPIRQTLMDLMLLAFRAGGRNEMEVEDDEYDDDDHFSENESDEDSDQAENSDEKEPPSQEYATLRGKLSIVLNKVDLVHPKSNLNDVAAEICSLAESCLEQICDGPVDNLHYRLPIFFYISALKKHGTDGLLQYLLEMATPSMHWEVEAGSSTSLTPEEQVEEIVREKIYRCLHKEVPYQIQQSNSLFRVVKVPTRDTASKGYCVFIHQEIIVRTKSHVDLVRGKGGQTLERIRVSAERDLERVFGCKVVLQLHLKLNLSKSRTI